MGLSGLNLGLRANFGFKGLILGLGGLGGLTFDLSVDLSSKRADFGPEKANFRPDRADFSSRGAKVPFGEQMDGQTNGHTDRQMDIWKFTHLSYVTWALWGCCQKKQRKQDWKHSYPRVGGQGPYLRSLNFLVVYTRLYTLPCWSVGR